MQIERFYLGCLAHASYIVHDDGEAAVIDPQRDVDLYIDLARERGVAIRWVIETHLHADFVSGHLELARRSGATICMGADSGAGFEHRVLHDGDELPLGRNVLRALATPGHTEESVCILAFDMTVDGGKPVAVFTGDTLFIGDVGRPDLSPTKTPQQLAAILYDSLHDKLLALPDDTVVYPAHGAGSLCGRNMSADSSSTIGRERRTNYALLARSREQFVELLTGDLPPRPTYFNDEVALNRSGATALEDLPPVPSLTPDQAAALQTEGAIILDTRSTTDFAAAHIPGSINVALSGQFASWAARVLGVGARVVIVAEDDATIHEARLRLARVGLEDVAGALTIFAWIEAGKPVQSLDQISAVDLEDWSGAILDVREASEHSVGTIPGAISIPLPDLRSRLSELDPVMTVLVHCKGGYRSSCAASILQASGFPAVVNLTGGYDAWQLAHGAESEVVA
ncbi:MAG TPA: rhodanese-like domain-containing protein [Acidobacteriaceae bacterium]|nr:rhodanese-like domain-containing protein [Acidobacteriaceae bacterium]